MLRYAIASGVSVVVGQLTLFVTFGLLRLASAVVCNIVSCLVAAIPSYYISRAWAWGRRGRSSLRREVLPFVAVALAALGISSGAVAIAGLLARDAQLPHLATAVVVNVAALLSLAVTWVVKYLLLDRVLFARARDGA